MENRTVCHGFGKLPVLTAFLIFIFGLSFNLLAEEIQPSGTQNFVPPNLNQIQSQIQALPQTETNTTTSVTNSIQQVSGQVLQSTTGQVVPIATKDPILGDRVARISNELKQIPKQAGQIWREYDITPYTQGRTFPAGTKPEQTIIDWILRQTGTSIWHTAPFGILTADSEKLYVYHTKEVQLEIADIVDRFVSTQFVNDSCKIRVVAVSRPDWISSGHRYLKPIPIVTPGVQGWIVEKDGTQLLLQQLGRRNDFKEIAPPQFLIPNGIAHNVMSKRQRTYLRDVQANATALNGYAEDRVTFDEGFSVSFTPLAVLDGYKIDAIIKLDVVQIEKMIPLMVDMPTATNPRQRIQVESPQVAHFSLDEQIRWPKDKILLLDLGTIPLPSRDQSSEASNNNILSGLKNLTGGIASSTNRANILLFIEHVSSAASQVSPIIQQLQQAVPQTQGTILANGQQQSVQQPTAPISGNNGQVVPTIGTNSSYWQGVR